MQYVSFITLAYIDSLQNASNANQGNFLKQVTRLGYDLYPLIFEDRTNQGDLLPKLRKLYSYLQYTSYQFCRWANPAAFFRSALKYAKEYQLKGFNVDFETLEELTIEDHLALQMFMDAFAGLMQSSTNSYG